MCPLLWSRQAYRTEFGRVGEDFSVELSQTWTCGGGCTVGEQTWGNVSTNTNRAGNSGPPERRERAEPPACDGAVGDVDRPMTDET